MKLALVHKGMNANLLNLNKAGPYKKLKRLMSFFLHFLWFLRKVAKKQKTLAVS